VITSLFGLFISAYRMRMGHAHGGDLHPLAVPRLLWVNTAMLILSSAGMQWARVAARQGQAGRMRAGLIVGVSSPGHSRRQLLAWRQLSASGYFMATNVAIAFFYLLTGVARAASARRPVRLGQDRRQNGAARHRADRSAPERRAVYRVLALPAVGLARPVRCAVVTEPSDQTLMQRTA